MNYICTTFFNHDFGKLSHFLGIEEIYTSDGLILSQQKYIYDLLKQAKMETCKPTLTLMATSSPLTKHGSFTFEDGMIYR